MRKRIKKSTWMPLALLVYTTAMAAYFLPKNTEISDTEKWVTFGASYVIVGLLLYVLRLKEQRLEKRNKEIEETYKKK
jgi:DMSO/TMAO reductase YedYZ heme-binding membrane subunit